MNLAVKEAGSNPTSVTNRLGEASKSFNLGIRDPLGQCLLVTSLADTLMAACVCPSSPHHSPVPGQLSLPCLSRCILGDKEKQGLAQVHT
jgi:hypothetical protein